MSNENYYDAGQVEKFERAAWEAAMSEAGKEWGCQQGEYYEREAMLDERISELEAENSRLKALLHDEMSQLGIANDLGNKRWIALNDIYENGEKHNVDWCRRRAKEGLTK